MRPFSPPVAAVAFGQNALLCRSPRDAAYRRHAATRRSRVTILQRFRPKLRHRLQLNIFLALTRFVVNVSFVATVLLYMEQLMSSLENALRVIALLDRDRQVLRVGEVCRILDLPKSSVSRLMKTLGDFDMLERAPDNVGYVAGPRTLVLGELYLCQHTLLDQVEPALQRLTDRFGFTGYASTLQGSDIVIIRSLQGAYPVRHVVEVGVPIPAYRTSVGRAALARLDDADLLALVRATAPDLKADDVLGVIADVRDSGVSVTSDTVVPGISAMAACVRDPRTDKLLAFSISYPANAVDAAMRQQMLDALREEAFQIGNRMGDAFWTVRKTAGPWRDI